MTRECTATHEAAHVVVACELGMRIISATIDAGLPPNAVEIAPGTWRYVATADWAPAKVQVTGPQNS
jgi:hypothetical protein